MKPIVTLALGIIIGAGAVWFMQKSSEKTLQVDEVIETYSTPTTGDNQGQTAPAQEPTTTGSSQGQMNLSDATTDGSQDSTTDSNSSQSQGSY